jgi:hypothetical protein
MKNIHVLPTEKPSRLAKNNKTNELFLGAKILIQKNDIYNNQNIYITSDEKIKKYDWYIADNKLYRASVDHNPELYTYGCKKLILTTDQDLIKDGVQAIDDEFLEWFVKNPSCEEVEVSYGLLKPFKSTEKGYMIHLPDNGGVVEPKQETLEEVAISNYRKLYEGEPLTQEVPIDAFKRGYKLARKKLLNEDEHKQETLELLEDPMSIESRTSWNKPNIMPNFDGEYLCYISCREECGNVHKYYKVVSCSFNTWIINENERITLWKKLPENPFND